MTLSAPTTVHIELTSGCVLKCRHCYNFWRHKDAPISMLEKDKLDFILKEIISNGVMHVIFTGGEPFLSFENLCYGIRRLRSKGITVSCNSNLLLATENRIKKLKNAGLEHILSSLNSYDASTNDSIVNCRGAFKRTIRAMKLTVASGIRISINMIITRRNITHIYKTGELAASLHAKNFFATRMVPSATIDANSQEELLIHSRQSRYVLNELLKVRDDFKIKVGTLVPFPLCFLNDLEKYKGFYMHGCPSGNKMLSINADGNVHACVHESENYGSIFDLGLKGVWKNMRGLWQKGEAFPKKCKACEFFEQCNSGCPLIAKYFHGALGSFDILRRGWKKKNQWPAIKINYQKETFRVFEKLRFREEKEFYVINRFGSEIICVRKGLAQQLLAYFKNKKVFTIVDFSKKYQKDFVTLIEQGLIVPLDS